MSEKTNIELVNEALTELLDIRLRISELHIKLTEIKEKTSEVWNDEND